MKECLILPPWSAGSLGDEYMVAGAAWLFSQKGYRVFVAEMEYPGSSSTFEGTVGPLLRDRPVHFIPLAQHRHCKDTPFYQVVAIGADTLDGLHSTEFSIETLRGLADAANAGKRVDIVSASYSNESKPEVDQVVRSTPALKWVARERCSFQRLKAIGAANVLLGCDFSIFLSRLVGQRIARAAVRQPLVSLAISPSVERIYGADLETALTRAITQLSVLAPTLRVNVVAHDYRSFGARSNPQVAKDISCSLAKKLSPIPVAFDGRRLTAREAWDVARRSTLVISGFMHFALMSSYAGTPSYFLSYSDKGIGQREMNPLFSCGDLQQLESFVGAYNSRLRLRRLEAWVGRARLKARVEKACGF